MKNIRTQSIFDFIKKKETLTYSELLKNFSDINESTLTRNLNKLINE